jgi:hypothetical protein
LLEETAHNKKTVADDEDIVGVARRRTAIPGSGVPRAATEYHE